jgi:hypothetical protein
MQVTFEGDAMLNAVLSQSQPSTFFTGPKLVAAAVLTAWFALIAVLGATGTFVTAPGTPPVPIAIGVMVPIVLFFGGLWMSRPFRDFVLATDIRLMVGIQAWRFAGLAFLAMYAYGLLPGMFALPAGFGDIAIGLTAPWILVALIRQPRFAASKTFVVWNLLGLLDLVVAVGTGALSAAVATGVAGEVITSPMAGLPLVLIPVYLVPILFTLHIATLMQVRRQAGDPRS